MAWQTSLKLAAEIAASRWATLVFGALILYASLRCIYLLNFHPAAKYPGPKLAAMSNIWYAYHWLTGKYPWAIVEVLKTYGDVVRIAPNELVFIRPQAAKDIYAPHDRYLERFHRTDFLDLGLEDHGIIWERDPVKHRKIAKRLSPAFSLKNIKAKEHVVHKYMDYFVTKLHESGRARDGIDLTEWTDWLALDISADMVYSRELNEMREMQNSYILDQIRATNLFGTVSQILKKFPLLSLVKFLFVPPSVMLTMPRVMKTNKIEMQARIDRRGSTTHLDYFEQLVPAHSAEPSGREKTHLESVAAQLILAGWEPMAQQFLFALLFLGHEPESYKRLVRDIRDAFQSYHDIEPDALASLKYLYACLLESMRLMPNSGATGLPRVSPGAMVDGHYVKKGITVQYGQFAFTRSSRFFHEPDSYHPQRWLPKDDPYYDAAFENDARDSFWPFSQGPRMCAGSVVAWRQMRLFVAKVLWSFDIEILSPPPPFDLKKSCKLYALWSKPTVRARLVSVVRD